MRILVERDVPMTTRDGVVLRADAYRRDDDGKYPAILVRTPYDKRLGTANDMLRAVDYAEYGYVVVIQDVRGRFASEGEFGGLHEGTDGYDAVEWVSGQPWCDGRVAMAGGSALGAAQFQAAMTQPPSLKAIAPAIVASSAAGAQFSGGALNLDRAISLFPAMAVDALARLEAEGKATTEMYLAVERARFDIEALYTYLPLKDLAKLLPGELGQRFPTMGALSPDGAPWNLIPRSWLWGRITVPALHIGGWHDQNADGTLTNWAAMRAEGGSAKARKSQHLLMGPWTHGAVLSPMVGGLHFGPEAQGALGIVTGYQLRFFDKYIRDMDVDLPPVRYFVMTENRWHNAEDWPLAGTDWQRFYLHSAGRANTVTGDGWLGREEPTAEPADLYVYDPRFPVPSIGGRNLGAGRLVSGPFDQSPIERRPDILVYSTPPLTEDMEVTGPLKLHLFALTSARDTDFVAKLTDVYPDGRSINVAEGIIRARFWRSLSNAELLEPGEVREYVIDLAGTSNLFRRGHRLRLDVTSSNFPRFDRNLNTGHPVGEDAEGIPAVQTILHERGRASYIDLPVIPSKR